MATLRCKSCGRVYSYEKNGTCPKCGAYNRPPRKEIVEADGTIHYVTTEQKVCYEEKECHEEDVRQETRSYNYTPEAPDDDDEEDEIGGQDNAVKKLWQHRNAIATSGGKKSVAAIAIITALISLVTTLVGNLSGNRHGISVQEPWESMEAIREIQGLRAHVGDTLITENGSVTINSCQATGDVLHIDLQCDDMDSLSISGYYETLTDSGYLDMVEAYSAGDLYTYLASLPEEIDAEDCAVVLDIPYEVGINRYFIWLEHPTYEMGEEFIYCNQEIYVDRWKQAGSEVQIQVCAEDETPVYSEAYLTVLNAAEQPYNVYWYGMQSRDAAFISDTKLRFDFTLRNENDTIQSITFCDTAGNHRQITVNLQ